MKITKLVTIVALVIVAIAVWQLSPGLRTRARSAAGKVGEWSEEARQADPVIALEDLADVLEDSTVTSPATVEDYAQREEMKALFEEARE